MTAPSSVASGALAALLPPASVEISSSGHQLQELKDNFAAGIDVTITFLPGDNYRNNVDTAVALRAAGLQSGAAYRRARNGLARRARLIFWRGRAARRMSSACC